MSEGPYSFYSFACACPQPELSGPGQEPGLPDVSLAKPLDILSLVSDVVRRCVPSCHDVRLIPSARLPVVTFAHRESSLRCDISVNNRSGP